MFKAIISGKAGTSAGAIAAGTSWSKAFQASEDLLTATVFERLNYLDGSTLWQILRATFPILPAYRVADLLEADFWPRWSAGEGGGQVEPDVVLRFEVGDPSRRIDLIVEAKLGGVQNAEQWLREWRAYTASMSNTDEQVDSYLLAIGGTGASATKTVLALKADVERLTAGTLTIPADAAGWQRLADVIGDVEPAHSHQARVIEDIVEALAHFGFRHLSGLNSLLTAPNFPKFDRSLAQLGRLR
ncbi:hypothetical protein [Devosia sp. Root105]|uniref:hypothetical protein n=1 Tax=Devosia sp. Root105 TaxID=1736423 RepID=UPI000714AB16|nr:hypothetical protein [Devosia sp. Root105]KQU93896.1 hypothetical protein ASC68_19630 [Devosia sp. Root105]